MQERLKIKVCGMRDFRNIEELIAVQPDYLGYIFYAASARYIGLKPDRKIFDIVPDEIEKVGVFVNEDVVRVVDLAAEYGLQSIQLHGDESVGYCGVIKGAGLNIIRAMGSDKLMESSLLESYSEVVDYFLFDTESKQRGGSGRKYDWSLLRNIALRVPWFLSGGISAEDADNILGIEYRGMYGVDINSRFELYPGMKDIGIVGQFIEEIRNGR